LLKPACRFGFFGCPRANWLVLGVFVVVIALLCPAVAEPTTDDVRTAQQALQSLGYKPGNADGIMGARTRAAFKKFQRKEGLQVTGELDQATMHALGFPEPAPPAPPAPPEPVANDSSSGSGGGFLFFVVLVGAVVVFALVKASKSKPPVPEYSTRTPATSSAPSYSQRAAQAPALESVNVYVSPVVRPVPQLATDTAAPELEAAVGACAKTSPPIAESPRAQVNLRTGDYSWIPGNQAVSFGTIRIPNGMFYIGTRLLAPQGSVENCLINPNLPVASTNPDEAGQTMPYWPSYTTISPESRLAYLQWLAGGKRAPSTYVGYVFLYFYGLERRLLLDNPGEEAADLIVEVERLLSLYGDNHSFRGYATKLIEAAKFKFGSMTADAEPVLGRRESELPLSIRVGIGRELAAGKTINADWMLAWYAASPERYLRTAATRCEQEFVALFRKRFVAKYPDGMKITAPRRRLSCSYQAASATFSVSLQGSSTDLPDIVALSAPLTALDPLVTSCMDDLAPYSRLIGRDPESRNTVRAVSLLPADMDGDVLAPMAQLSAFLEEAARGPAATLALDTLLSKLDVKTTEKGRIAKADLIMMSDALARCGFGIEPDPLSSGSALNGADKVVLFRAPGGGKTDATKPSYLAARTLIDIGALVATADGMFSEDEVRAIESEVVRAPGLSELERMRLLAYLAFLSKNPPSTRILARFKDQPPEKRQALAQLAVAVAAADGQLATEEVKLLEKIYRVLGLADGTLYSDLQSFAAADETLPTVAPADHGPSVAIPRPASEEQATGIRLDPARLARTRTDTAKVSQILSEVFSDDAKVVDEISSTAEPANDEGPIAMTTGWDLSGLAAPCARLLSQLKGCDSITRTDFTSLAQKQNLLADGAIEAINDWALEKFDEPLIDEGDPIEIAFHLLVQNQQDAA
jgi:peptidoglycan hydrolase-like protein with peptidoglycan-binding domain/tellurite resistance protein